MDSYWELDMASGNTERTRTARLNSVSDVDAVELSGRKMYRCQVYLYPKEPSGYSAVVPVLLGIQGHGQNEQEALDDVTRILEGVIPTYTNRGERIPWLEDPADPEPGAMIKWVFPKV
jgi:predicted RNase H-like HicB family nuclease